MGNSHSSTATVPSESKKDETRFRRNSTVKARMFTRFVHKKSVPQGLSLCSGEDFTDIHQQTSAGSVVRRAVITTATTPTKTENDNEHDEPPPTKTHQSADEIANKRISYISQGADSAKDALELGNYIKYYVTFYFNF